MEDHLHTWRDYLVELITWIERGIGMYGENDDDHSINKLLEEARQGLKINRSLQEEMEATMAEQGGEVRNVEERDGGGVE